MHNYLEEIFEVTWWAGEEEASTSLFPPPLVTRLITITVEKFRTNLQCFGHSVKTIVYKGLLWNRT